MERPQRAGPQTWTRATAAVLSVGLHLVLLLAIVLSGGPGDGVHQQDAAAAEWVPLQSLAQARRARSTRAEPAMPEDGHRSHEPPDLVRMEPPTLPVPEIDIPEAREEEPAPGQSTADEYAFASLAEDSDRLPALVMAEADAAGFLQRIEAAAGALAESPHTRVSWQQDGRHYVAELVLQSARDGLEPDRAIAEVSTEQQGRRLRTRISLRRLPFSHYAQVIDRWDPMVQLHDDEVVGRMHVNSRFRALYDAEAAPRLHGKVTTAAGGFTVVRQGREGDVEMFPDGIETGTRPIPFSGSGWSFEPVRQQADARVHEVHGDTRIRFLGRKGYTWQEGRFGKWQKEHAPAAGPVYFLGSPRAVVSVQGVVSGKFLVYSPRRIVVEDDLTYARDPRQDPFSEDFLGLVCDRDIEVAPAALTGPGDLHVQAALFARRRVVVADVEQQRSATLHVFGSLAAGTLLESEPRYATKITYDWRFERLRPPGFPSTNRFATDDWDRQWTEVPERSVSAGY